MRRPTTAGSGSRPPASRAPTGPTRRGRRCRGGSPAALWPVWESALLVSHPPRTRATKTGTCIRGAHSISACRASSPIFSVSRLLLRGLIALASPSSYGTSCVSMPMLWRCTTTVPLDLFLAGWGRCGRCDGTPDASSLPEEAGLMSGSSASGGGAGTACVGAGRADVASVAAVSCWREAAAMLVRAEACSEGRRGGGVCQAGACARTGGIWQRMYADWNRARVSRLAGRGCHVRLGRRGTVGRDGEASSLVLAPAMWAPDANQHCCPRRC